VDAPASGTAGGPAAAQNEQPEHLQNLHFSARHQLAQVPASAAAPPLHASPCTAAAAVSMLPNHGALAGALLYY